MMPETDDCRAPADRTEERRKNRLKIPRCPNCGSDGAQIVTRLITVLYARCVECSATWGVPRPGTEAIN